MESILPKAIESVQKSQRAYCKFISANDAGITKSHQSGFLISKSAWSLFFDSPGVKGSNKDFLVKIKWQDDFETDSRFIYYGQETRNEYRLTRFKRGFPFRRDETVGDLLIIAKLDTSYYEAFVLSADEDIEDFLNTFGISAADTNAFIPKAAQLTSEQKIITLFEQYIASLKVEFPEAAEVSMEARRIYRLIHSIKAEEAIKNPDSEIIKWIEIEFDLFKSLENNRYGDKIKKPFGAMEDMIEFSNTVLNRRKSRAGKALENHLSEVFSINNLRFEKQVKTEGNKKPDFIFPGAKEYHNLKFEFGNLFFLGAKTTCKDRWRQILNEANRIPVKHLFTLQQGVSSNQLEEMQDEKVKLVVPASYIKHFPPKYQTDLIPLNQFINTVKASQA